MSRTCIRCDLSELELLGGRSSLRSDVKFEQETSICVGVKFGSNLLSQVVFNSMLVTYDGSLWAIKKFQAVIVRKVDWNLICYGFVQIFCHWNNFKNKLFAPICIHYSTSSTFKPTIMIDFFLEDLRWFNR